MNLAIKTEPEGFDVRELNRRVPLAGVDDPGDREAALDVRADLWRSGPADEAAVFAAVALRVMQGGEFDLESPEVHERGNRLFNVLRNDPTLAAPPGPRAAAWAGRVFEDEQRQDLLVVAAGRFLAGRLPEVGEDLFQRLRELDWVGLPDADIAAVAQALMRLRARAQLRNRTGTIDPVVGYGLVRRVEIGPDSLVREIRGSIAAVDPGLMRLRIVGDLYELECELWPCSVTMKASDFIRARSSAREIFKQTGIQADNPAGRWRMVWELAGLRDRLIEAADRDDPGERQSRLVAWLAAVESTAPLAERAMPDGSAARLPDGAVVASMPWLVAKCIGDAIARENEREAIEAVIRGNTRESIRRTDGGRQVRLRLVPTKPPLVIEGR